MNKTIVTEENFDSQELFAGITKDAIADMFSDPNTEAVASINARLQAGRSLSDAVRDEISASVNFANDDVAKDWCRFVGAYNADKATAAYAQKWLREQEMDSCTMDDIVQACCDVEDSRSYAKTGLVNKTVCRMLHDRIAKAADWNSDLPICNIGSAFTRNIQETELLYKTPTSVNTSGCSTSASLDCRILTAQRNGYVRIWRRLLLLEERTRLRNLEISA